MSHEQRKRYDQQFKIEAVKLVMSGRPLHEVARNLGIHPTMLTRWKRQYLQDPNSSFPGKGHQKPDDERYRTLEQRLKEVTEERDILKKAVAVFSKHSK